MDNLFYKQLEEQCNTKKEAETKEVINMTEQYYDYLMDTFKDVISDIAVNLAFSTGGDRQYDKGKMDAYVDIMHMIYEDFMEDFKGR